MSIKIFLLFLLLSNYSNPGYTCYIFPKGKLGKHQSHKLSKLMRSKLYEMVIIMHVEITRVNWEHAQYAVLLK